jgi:hypothetical protein
VVTFLKLRRVGGVSVGSGVPLGELEIREETAALFLADPLDPGALGKGVSSLD